MGKHTETTMSQDLVWQLVRNNSSFIHKRRCGSNKVLFNSEPNNLTNLNRFKDSGLANAKAISLVADEKGVAMAITKSTRDSFYRSDLSDAALARWYKIWKSQD